ncbi:hypothetical protein P4S72_14305 [Vibrio sp. PP-XX7]
MTDRDQQSVVLDEINFAGSDNVLLGDDSATSQDTIWLSRRLSLLCIAKLPPDAYSAKIDWQTAKAWI